MKQKNRETMQKAIGVIEGLSWLVDSKTSEALFTVYEMLDTVMKDEVEE